MTGEVQTSQCAGSASLPSGFSTRMVRVTGGSDGSISNIIEALSILDDETTNSNGDSFGILIAMSLVLTTLGALTLLPVLLYFEAGARARRAERRPRSRSDRAAARPDPAVSR